MSSRRNMNNRIRQVAMSIAGTIFRLAILALCVLFITRAGKYAYNFAYRIFAEEPMSAAPGRDVSVTIVQGDSLMDVCKMLEEKGLVRDAKLTWVQKKVSVYDNDVKPDFYTLNTSMTADEMFAIIAGSSEDMENENEEESVAAPLSEGEGGLDSIIDSTIPEEGIVFEEVEEGGEDIAEEESAEE